MKKSVILDIFNGEKGSIGSIDYTPRVKSNYSTVFEQLKATLNIEQLKLYEKSLNEFATELCDEVDFYFVEGFKLGLLIGIECMDD